MKFQSIRSTWLPFLLTVVLGFLVMGYHPGMEDDGIYLSAIKSQLNPSLFPHPDAVFFRLQLQASFFDNCMAELVRLTGLSIAWTELLGQFFSIGLILWACLGIAREVFEEVQAHWASVTMVAAMFTLPVSGTALFIADQHLHPRNLATGFILMAVLSVLRNRPWLALPWLAIAGMMHPLMAALGASFTLFAVFVFRPSFLPDRTVRMATLAVFPIRWLFDPANAGWEAALNTRTSLHLYRWSWYEWLGALAPLLLFLVLDHVGRQQGWVRLSLLARCVLAYGIFHQLLAMLLLAPEAPPRLIPLQPMRYLQLVYLFMVLFAGGLLGRFVLRKSLWRWAVYLLVINGSMFAAQRAMFPASLHLELPGRSSGNPWLQAFQWIRENTPGNAYFILNPRYMDEEGEDYHCFRALAERSQLADAVKDTAVVTQIPELADQWKNQLQAENNYENFHLQDFQRLKSTLGVDWAVVAYPQKTALDCRWHNATLAVCRIP